MAALETGAACVVGGERMTYVINVKDIIGAAILCALAVASLILFAVAVIGEKVRQYQKRKIDAAYKEDNDGEHS